ncbi:hypothetical protein ACLI09_16355 [Flavobacterium sp. RHBU_24]|uniref:hypothetical protein n=1 Tax=Flavobacterium sp. RHBU_24 TaxID=3391185 RepID=UPI0039855208
MKPRFLIISLLGGSLLVMLCIASCSRKHLDVQVPMALTGKDSLQIKADSLLGKSTPIMGYRFVITGDFDGDKITDTLIERYTDSLYIKEAPKYYTSADTTFEYSDVLFLNSYLEYKSFINWKQKQLRLPGGHLGFHYIENCGDVNDDGKDELMLVNQWGDFSNCNSAHFYTYADGQWEKIYTTPIWEWQFPPTPSASMFPGLFGNFDYGTTDDVADNAALEAQLKAFRFIKWYPDHSVEFNGRNDIGVNGNDAAYAELEKIGDMAYIKKYFRRAVLNDSLYFRRIDNPSIYYRAGGATYNEDGEDVPLLPLDDGASDVTTRIFIRHPQSPFNTTRR